MKKILIALAAAAMMFSSCETEEQLGPAALKVLPESMDLALDGETQTLNLKATRDWTVTLEGENVEGITVTPMEGKGSNEPITITVEAAKNEGYNRNFKIVFTSGAMEAKVAVKQPGSLGASISDIYSLTEGDEISVQGLVIAAHERGCIIEDETGKALVFAKGATASYTEVGTTIRVTGKVALHNGNPQIIPATEDATFDATTFVQKTDAAVVEVTFPADATVVTKDNWSDVDWDGLNPIILTGKFTMSPNGDDFYYNINFGAENAKGSISYPLASLGLADLADKNVEFKGYTVGGGSFYQNILVVDAEEKALQLERTNISDILNKTLEKGTAVKVEGQVVATYQRGFVIKDDTGLLLAYIGSDAYKADTFPEVGNNVTVEGNVSKYDNQIEDVSVTANDKVTTLPTYDTPRDISTTIDAEAEAGVSAPYYAKVTGVLGGNNANEIKNGEQKYFVSMNYTFDSYSALKGQTVTATGFITSKQPYSDPTTGKLNMIVTDFEAAPFLEAADASVDAAVTSAQINVSAFGLTDGWNFDFEGGKPDWITEAKKEEGKIVFTLVANESSDPRTATVNVSATGVTTVQATLTQAGALAADAITLEFDFTKAIAGWPTEVTKETGTYKYTLNGAEYSFILECTTGGYHFNSNGGYLFIKSDKSHGYMGLPVIADKALTKVVITPGTNASASVEVGIVAADKTTTVCNDVVWAKVNNVHVPHEYMLEGIVGEQYYLHTAVKNCQITKLKLIYQ